MAGEVRPPEMSNVPALGARNIEVETLIIGGGEAGVNAALSVSGSAALVTRSSMLGDGLSSKVATQLPSSVTILKEHEVFGLFDTARIVLAAPHDPTLPAAQIKPKRVVIATGKFSVAPLVPGAALPGVLDAKTALVLVERYGVSPGNRIVVVGTDRGAFVAERLSELGCNVVDFTDVARIDRIEGISSVRALIFGGRKLRCDAVVHAGPWRSDPSLPFQAGADGDLRLMPCTLPSHVSLVGACATTDDPISWGRQLDRRALVCPCMDVTVDEVLDLICQGITHIEELKRRTTCGMGSCQGVPCWSYLAAIVADATGLSIEEVGHPSYRPPRAAVTIAQAAGLSEITGVEA